MSGEDLENGEFYLRYYVGHKGKFGHEFLEFEFRPDGKLRYANNSNYKNDTMIRKEVYLTPAVLRECRRIISDSEVRILLSMFFPSISLGFPLASLFSVFFISFSFYLFIFSILQLGFVTVFSFTFEIHFLIPGIFVIKKIIPSRKRLNGLLDFRKYSTWIAASVFFLYHVDV